MATEADPLIGEDDESASHKLVVQPKGSASSFFFFVPPLLRRRMRERESYVTGMIVFAGFLVFLNYAMQIGLLYAVGNHVVGEREAWQNSVIRLRRSDDGKEDRGGESSSPKTREARDKLAGFGGSSCSEKEALCLFVDGMYTCSPKSVQLFGRWEQLDTNKDGIWSFEEASAKSSREATKCRFGIDSLNFYEFVRHQLTHYDLLLEEGLLHPNLTDSLHGAAGGSGGGGIHKAYFDWFRGDVVMCGYGVDSDVCGNVFAKGVFDSPMKYPGVSKRITDSRSAWKYCEELLRPEGRCERMLPSTYEVWRVSAKEQCGAREHQIYLYSNPRDAEDVVSLTKVRFGNHKEYEKTLDWSFTLFLWIILLVFYATLLAELREAIRLAVWVAYFPTRPLPGEPGFEELGEQDDTTLTGISTKHRKQCRAIVVVKFVMVLLVGYVGTIFLTSDTSYMNLLFDALSLAFIIQVDALLYETMVRPQAKEELEGVQSMHIGIPRGSSFRFYQAASPPLRDLFWALGLLVLAGIVLWEDYHNRLNPMRKALECACSVSGEECFEAQHYSRDWWDNYWRVVVPSSYKEINRLVGKAA